MKNFIKTAGALALVLSLNANAGNESHGGDIVLCEGKPTVVLDYFHAALPAFGETTANIEDISGWSKERTVLFLKNKLETYLIRFDIEAAYMKIGLLESWIESDLKEVDDSNEPYFLPKDCQRKQGAVRQGDQVFVDPTYVKQLSASQLGILEFHEAVFYVANKRKILTSEAVRSLVRTLLRKDSTNANLFKSIKDLGAKAYAFEYLVGTCPFGAYTSPHSDSPSIFFTRANPETREIQARYCKNNVVLPYPPAVIQCNELSTKCKVVTPAGNNGLALGDAGKEFEIHDGGRMVALGGSGMDHYFRYFEDEFPFNGRK